MIAVAKLMGARVYAPAQLATLAGQGTEIGGSDPHECLDLLRTAYADFCERSGDSMDKAAKGSAFVEVVFGAAFPA